MHLLCFGILLLFVGCSWKTFAPTIGGGVGAGAGALVGNPVGGAVIGGTLGAGAGQLVHEIDESEGAKATVKLLTEGDVMALMDDHKTGVEGFMESIKKWLFVTAIALGAYLMIPIFVAKRTAQTCSKNEIQKHQSRAPFPVKK